QVAVEAEQAGHQRAEHGAPVAAQRHLRRPQLAREALAGLGVVAQRHHRGIDAAAAAAYDHVDVDGLAAQHLPQPQRGGALHRARADDDGDALALARRRAHSAPKLSTASSTAPKILRMVAKPLSSSTLRTFGLMSARRMSPPRRRASFTV